MVHIRMSCHLRREEMSKYTKTRIMDAFLYLLNEKSMDRLTVKDVIDVYKRQIQKLSRKFAHIDYTKPAHTNLITKFKFLVCRMMQQSIHQDVYKRQSLMCPDMQNLHGF